VSEQLDIFTMPLPDEAEPDTAEGHDEPAEQPQRSQLRELPGDTFEDIFGDAA
jgi:hypothetical protein